MRRVRVAQDVTPLRALGPRQLALYNALSEPRTAPELGRATGVSRQAIDQLLKKLMKQGRIRRLPNPGETARWLYVQSSITAISPKRRQPSLSPVELNLFNLLPYSGSVALRDLRKALPTYHGALARLISKGLVERTGTGSLKVVHLSAFGRQQGCHQPSRETIATVNEARLILPKLLNILLALEAFGEARALDLTRVTPRTNTGTAELLRRLRVRGFISQHAPRQGRAFAYRLTETGAELVTKSRER